MPRRDTERATAGAHLHGMRRAVRFGGTATLPFIGVDWNIPRSGRLFGRGLQGAKHMNGIIYLVGLVVVVLFILSFLGLR
jgi:hypothetical protein